MAHQKLFRLHVYHSLTPIVLIAVSTLFNGFHKHHFYWITTLLWLLHIFSDQPVTPKLRDMRPVRSNL